MATPAEVRTAFLDASDFLMQAIGSVPEDGWDRPGLGVWNVRELCVHACRAWSTTLQYSAQTAELTLQSPLEYFLAVLNTPGDLHGDVAQRTRESAAALGDPIPHYAAGLHREVQDLLGNTDDDRVIANFAGGIRFIDYLPTRVLELVVHGIDIHHAVATPPNPPTSASGVAMELLGELAVARMDSGEFAGLVRGLTGRAPFPSDINLLA